MPYFNSVAAEPIHAGIRQLFQALALGPTLKAQKQQQQALFDAQQQYATQQAYKAALDTHFADHAQQQREQAMQALADSPSSAGYKKNLLLLMQLLGNQANPTTLTQGALNAQKGVYRDSVLQKMGDTATDQGKVTFLNALLEGKPYTPYVNIGTTGYALNRETGQGVLAAPSLAEKTQGTSRKHYDAEYGRVIDLGAHTASPITTPNGEGISTRAQQAEHRARVALQGSMAQLDRLARAAQEVQHTPALSRITGAMGHIPNFPGSAAADVAARLQTLKTQVGFAALQAMRDASKTGGALGNVSNFEVQSLQNSLASLEPTQSTAALRENLQQIIDYVAHSKARLRDAMRQDYPKAVYEDKEAMPTLEQSRSIPSAAIEYLKSHPHLREAFDQHYGPGSAARVLGL